MKLVIDEPESEALAAHLAGSPQLASSRIAIVEVHRATELANPRPEVRRAAAELLRSTMLVAVSDELLEAAHDLTSRTLRSLDAIHLASAIRIGADELLAYDHRLLTAADEHGLPISSPGAIPA